MEINKKFQSGFCNCFNVIGLPNYFNFPKHYMYVKNISLLKIHSFKNSYFLVFKLFDGDCGLKNTKENFAFLILPIILPIIK